MTTERKIEIANEVHFRTVGLDRAALSADNEEQAPVIGRAVPIAEARQIVAAIEAEGGEASYAVDQDDRALAWIWL